MRGAFELMGEATEHLLNLANDNVHDPANPDGET